MPGIKAATGLRGQVPTTPGWILCQHSPNDAQFKCGHVVKYPIEFHEFKVPRCAKINPHPSEGLPVKEAACWRSQYASSQFNTFNGLYDVVWWYYPDYTPTAQLPVAAAFLNHWCETLARCNQLWITSESPGTKFATEQSSPIELLCYLHLDSKCCSKKFNLRATKMLWCQLNLLYIISIVYNIYIYYMYIHRWYIVYIYIYICIYKMVVRWYCASRRLPSWTDVSPNLSTVWVRIHPNLPSHSSFPVSGRPLWVTDKIQKCSSEKNITRPLQPSMGALHHFTHWWCSKSVFFPGITV